MASEIHEERKKVLLTEPPTKSKRRGKQDFVRLWTGLDERARKRQGLLSLCQILQLT